MTLSRPSKIAKQAAMPSRQSTRPSASFRIVDKLSVKMGLPSEEVLDDGGDAGDVEQQAKADGCLAGWSIAILWRARRRWKRAHR